MIYHVSVHGNDSAAGTPVDFTVDVCGNRRAGEVCPGPFADLKAGEQRITVWRE